MFQWAQSGDGRWNFAAEGVVGEVQDCQTWEFVDIGGNLARELVANEVQDAEGGKHCDSGEDLLDNVFPISDDKGGEGVDAADRWWEFSIHVAGATNFLKDWVFGLPVEVDVADAAGGGVATDAVPVETAVGAHPRVEEVKVGLV